MVVLDLFSGAGGLSEGFFRANSTFVAHIESDKYACETLKTRTSYWKL
ncbi:DNA cytosine methyltransferase, partial [Campylobacter coli]|nr:DNA cytosine methyltransferase [Campylobacter coli]